MQLVVVVFHSMVVDHALGVQGSRGPQTYTISYLQGLSVPTSVHPTVGIQCISPTSRVALKREIGR